MQILATGPLVEKFRANSFEDDETSPYFFAYMILTSASWFLAYGEQTGWDFLETFANVAITILGIHYLKSKNGNMFGNGFLNKYFSLGWVISVRLLLVGLPTMVVVYAILSIKGTEELPGPLGVVFGITFSVMYYRWLGVEFARAQKIEGDSAGVR